MDNDKEMAAIVAARQKNNVDVQFFWYDNRLLFYPAHEVLLEELRFTEKKRVCDKSTRFIPRMVFNKTNAYSIVKRHGDSICVTFQGFANTLLVKAVRSNLSFDIQDLRLSTAASGLFPEPRYDLMHGFRFSQEKLLTDMLKQDCSGLLEAPTRYGKCLVKDTEVLMYDYSTKKVQDIVVGDLLMSPKGKPVKVIALGRGREQAYQIIPKYGEPFSCNESHILSLRTLRKISHTSLGRGAYTTMTVKEFLSLHPKTQRSMALWWAPLELGFTETNTAFMKITKDFFTRAIPKEYMTTSVAYRCVLLWFILNRPPTKQRGFIRDVRTKSEEFAKSVIQLCRSLGLGCHRRWIGTRQCWEVKVFGDPMGAGHETFRSEELPFLTTSPFKVKDIGEQDYYGFELEGEDKLFLLWDHLVTHNTTLMVNTLRAFPNLPAVVTAPGVDLIQQLYDDITGSRGIRGREVKLIGGGKNQKPTMTGINVVSMDSLHKIDESAVRLLLCDEPHAAPATSRLNQIDRFLYARRYGFGATLEGRSDGKDLLIQGLFGPVLTRRTYLEAVEEGAICPLHIIFLKVELYPQWFRTRDDAYDSLLFDSHDVALIVADICHNVIPPEQQTLIFIKHENQADLFMDKIGRDTSLAMAKRMTNAERQETTRLLRENVITRCLCTRIFVQGVTFPDVRVLINAEAGGNTTSAIQKPGRLAQIREGKKCGIVIDLNFVARDGFDERDYRGEPWTAPITDSKSRRKAYEKKGYTIHDVKNIRELKTVFDSLQ